MFLITNRAVRRSQGDPTILGKKPNVNGPNELRIVEAKRRAGKWQLEVLPDESTEAMRTAVGMPARPPKSERHIAAYTAHCLLQRINPQAVQPRSRRKGRDLLVFVHGYNNDVQDVLDRAALMESKYGIEVLPFSWPANGGGLISGTASYKSDKRDAKASVGALDRALSEIGRRLQRANEDRMQRIRFEAAARFPDNIEQQHRLVARTLEKECPFTVNLALHSMGNYLYKHLLLSTASEGTGLIFDNVVLCAADTNNAEHTRWVDRIRCRRRVYVTINEDDTALRFSRMKSGSEQLARLGHYPFNLTSEHAAYVQLTGADRVGSSHAYFADDALRNPKVRAFFRRVFRGERADEQLRYDAGSNTYRV
ncbi:MAG: alpha/beta hydrolase [Planctomycetota bacterium]